LQKNVRLKSNGPVYEHGYALTWNEKIYNLYFIDCHPWNIHGMLSPGPWDGSALDAEVSFQRRIECQYYHGRLYESELKKNGVV
jgi:hypothetical protein